MKFQRNNHMRWAPAFLLLALSAAASSLQQPFRPAQTPAPLARRQQDGCLSNYYSCASQGSAFSGICCEYGQVCSLDASNQPACCPSNAVCTGTAPSTFATPSASTQSVSFVANSYFSFPYVATSFANAGQCSSAVSACSANYAACTSDLAGGNNGAGGVTVVVGSSTTVAGAGQAGVTLATASASSVCSSLSSQACMGLQAAMCTGAGVTSGGFYFGSGTGNAAAPRATGVGMGMGLMGVGVGVGLGVMAGL